MAPGVRGNASGPLGPWPAPPPIFLGAKRCAGEGLQKGQKKT